MLRHATGFVLANRARTRARCKVISGTAAFNRLSAIPSWHQTASRTFGASKSANTPIAPLNGDKAARSRALNCIKAVELGSVCNRETVKDCRAPSSNGYGQPPDATSVRSYVPLQSRQAANLLSEVFIETFLLRCAGPQGRAIGLDPPAPTPRP